MTNDTRSPEEIERDIARERQGLSRTLDELQNRFSVEGLTQQFSEGLRDHAGEITHSVSQAVKRNPTALAVTGIGLAWLIFGDRSSRKSQHRSDHGDVHHYSTMRHHGAARHDAYHSASDQDAAYQGASGGYDADSTPSWARTDNLPLHGSPRHGFAGTGSTRDRSTHSGDGYANGMAETASDAAHAAADRARDLGDNVSSAAGSARDGIKDTARSAADRAAALRDRLSEGTEQLSEEARKRVIAARERAVEARDAAMVRARQTGERASDLYEEHPLVAGALAVAVGAGIGAALPRSRTEDAYLGQHSDTLMDEAERIFAEEKAKLGEVARAAGEEAKKVARETKDDLDENAPGDSDFTDALKNKARQSGERVADAAKSEADKQDLGNVKH
ncbi:DUF3618 domain-containing protein [Roseovarius sp. C7]|uniref:DUF3618 domain-containing protein n=1 Tax=Roseovarius sp. C7 TaxID=3398643 RepID=UPI0039F68165